MAIKSFKINKLIRDRLVSVMKAKGIVMHKRILPEEEYIEKLKDKLLEEAQEVKETESTEDQLEELADVLEVIHALSKAFNLSMEQIEEKRIKKRELKGGFEDRIFGERMDIEEDHPEIAYPLSKPKHYPQID